jgi:hypothetical protein
LRTIKKVVEIPKFSVEDAKLTENALIGPGGKGQKNEKKASRL